MRTAGLPGRAGHTLAELVVSTVAISFLIGGMTSAIYVTARAADPANLPAYTIRGSTAAERIAAELSSAISFAQRSATAVEFTVHDRDDDASDETVRYQWSATPGDPITRRYNGGNVADFLQNVHAFNLDYEIQTVADPETGDRYYVRRVVVELRVGEDSRSSIHAIAPVMNSPEVATP